MNMQTRLGTQTQNSCDSSAQKMVYPAEQALYQI